MSFEISMSDNIKEVRKTLTRIQRQQLPFATANALTQTAKDAQAAVTRQIPLKLDRPARFTQNAIGFSFAKKTALVSEVFVKRLQAQYLKWQIDGGTRTAPGKGTGVPTKNKRLNQFGNIPGRKAGLVKGSKEFIATINGISGVWQRTGGKKNPGIKLMVAFEPAVQYDKRLPFYTIAANTAANRFHKQFSIALARALATAR